MNAEIIAVGSELLLGQINNTNARFISSQLSEIGINIFYHTVVGDNGNRLVEAIKIAEGRADLIIFSGGLGPTKDDLTKETIAQHLQTKLVQNDFAMQMIEEYFVRQGRVMTENNRKQALILKDSEVLENHHGMAPGMLYEKNHKTYILLPGPPKELEPMFQYEAKPKLVSRLHDGAKIISHVLRFYGIGEAELEEKIQHILDTQTNPTVAPLAGDGEVTLRITAKANNEEAAWGLIFEKQKEIFEVEGIEPYLYGVNDESLSSKLAAMLIQNELTIACAESLTAGLFASELANNKGISTSLIGGVITYTAQSKVQQLGVAQKTIDTYGVVSSECAAEMAQRVKEKFHTNIGVGLTGAAGPDAHDGQPAGTIWIGIAIGQSETITYCLHLSNNRNTNRIRTVKKAFSLLIQLLVEKGYRKLV